jgi:HEAT repeat protein
MNFDFGSFLLGSAFTWVLVFFIYRNREILADRRDLLIARAKQFREDLTAGADRRYRRELAARANVTRAGAWVVPLETVFVEPFLQARVPEPNPYGPPDTGTDWIGWAWPKVRRILPGGLGRRLRVTQVFSSNWRIALTGAPGEGKSTLLAYLALVAAGGVTHANFTFDDNPLPLWAHLADMLDGMARSGEDPAQVLIEGASHRAGAISAQRLPGLARRRLNDGRCLVLLDGLDELLPAERQVAQAWIERFVKRYADNRVVVAAPATGLKPLRDVGFVEVGFAPWTTQSLRQVHERWAAAVTPRPKAPGDEDEDDEFAPRKKKPQGPPPVAAWMETPLDVALGQFIENVRAQTPHSRFELYSTAVSAALWTPENLPAPAVKGGAIAGGLAYPPGAAAEDFLAGAAFDMLSSGRSAVPWQELELRLGDVLTQHGSEGRQDLEMLLDRLLKHSGLLTQHSQGRLSITHCVLQSFLAARHLLTHEADVIQGLLDNPAWSDALVFYAGQPDAHIGTFVGQRLSASNDVLRDAAFLTSDWAGMAPSNIPWRGPVMASVARQMLQPAELPAMRERACAALVASHDPGVGLLLKRAIAAPEEQLRRIAALGLGALRELAPADSVALLGARMSDEAPAVRLAAAHALAAIGSEDAVDALVHALLEGDDELRRAAAEGLGANPGEGHRVLQEAIADRDYLVRRAAAYGLIVPALAGHEWATQLLQETEREDGEWFVRSAATEGLQRLADLYTAQTLVPLHVENIAWLVQWAAQKGVGTGTGDAALKALGGALLDPEPRVRAAAALTLAQLGESSATDVLAGLAASDPDVEARQAALIALAVLRRLEAPA